MWKTNFKQIFREQIRPTLRVSRLTRVNHKNTLNGIDRLGHSGWNDCGTLKQQKVIGINSNPLEDLK